MKKIFSLLLCLPFLCSLTAFAKTVTIEKVEEFKTTDNDYSYTFEETITSESDTYTLKKVDYEVIDTEETTIDSEVERSFTWRNLETQNFEFPESTDVEIDGEKINCKFQSVEWSKTGLLTDRSRPATKEIESEYLAEAPKFPNTSEITFTDSATGKLVTATLNYVNTEVAEPLKWLNDFNVTLKVTDYDSELYYLNETVAIPFNDEKPIIDGIENDILKTLGLDTDKYKINTASWQGEPYEQNGYTMRNAVLSGERLVGKWKANYSANVPLPDIEGYNAVTYYRGTKSLVADNVKTVKATATYEANIDEVTTTEEDTESVRLNTTHKPFPLLPVVATTASAVVVIAFGAFIYLTSFNNVTIYDFNNKRLFGTTLKSKDGTCVADISKVRKYSHRVVYAKVSKSAQNKVERKGIQFKVNGKATVYTKKNNLYEIELVDKQ